MVLLFLFLSADEAASIHESIGQVLSETMTWTETLGFTYAWVVFGVALLGVVGLAYARLLLWLRPRFALGFCVAAGVFVLGSVIAESVGAAVESGMLATMPLGLTWPRLIALEELLEMLGVILLIRTLLEILALGAAPYRAGAGTG